VSTVCPRCRAVAAEGQEYCLECGLRLPGPGRLGPDAVDARGLRAPLLASFAFAAAGAAAAIALTWDTGGADAVITATGGSVTATTPVSVARGFGSWPRGRDGWTVVLVSIPKQKGGRKAALARARQAQSRGLPQVGIADSGTVGSLHPGYWIVFTGVYDTEPEATGALHRARTVARTAATRRMAA
jgi:hypothetical protein